MKRAERSRHVKGFWVSGTVSLMLPRKWLSNLFWTAAPSKKYVLHHDPRHTRVCVCARAVGTRVKQCFRGEALTWPVPAAPRSSLCLFFGWGGVSYFQKTAPLRCSSCTTRFIQWTCTIRWFSVIHRVVQWSAHLVLGRSHHLTKNLSPLLSPVSPCPEP